MKSCTVRTCVVLLSVNEEVLLQMAPPTAELVAQLANVLLDRAVGLPVST